MKVFKYIAVALLMALLVVAFGEVTNAAVDEPASDRQLVQTAEAPIPQIYVYDTKLDKDSYNSGDTIKGSFVVYNYSNTNVAGLLYETILVGNFKENGIPTTNYGSVTSNVPFLGPKASTTINFTYTIPQGFGGGDKALFIRTKLTSGFHLGQEISKHFDVSGGSSWLNGLYSAVGTGAKGYKDREYNYYPLHAGPTIYQGKLPSQAIISFTLQNKNKEAITVTPTLSVYKKDISGEKVFESELKDRTFTVAPGKDSGNTIIELPNLDYTPGVYEGLLTFKDSQGMERSSWINFRYIIGGDIYEIHTLISDKTSINKGDQFMLKSSYSGTPVDLFSSDKPNAVESQRAKVEVVVFNESDKKVAETSDTVDFAKGQVHNFALKSNGDAAAMRAEVTINSEAGKLISKKYFVLSPDYDAAHANPPTKSAFNYIIWIVVGLVLLVVVVKVGLHRSATFQIVFILACILGLVLVLYPIVTRAFTLIPTGTTSGYIDNTVDTYGWQVPNIYVSAPMIDTSYIAGTPFTITGSVSYWACSNDYYNTSIKAYNYNNAGTTTVDAWLSPTVGTKITDSIAAIVPDNALTSNNVYTVFDSASDIVNYSSLNMTAIPSDAVITGIEISVEGKKSGVQTLSVSISPDNGASFTTIKNLGSTFTTIDSTLIAGGSTDTWGRTWSASEFANGSLKIRLAGDTSLMGTISVDQIRMRISYIPSTILIGTETKNVAKIDSAANNWAHYDYSFSDSFAFPAIAPTQGGNYKFFLRSYEKGNEQNWTSQGTGYQDYTVLPVINGTCGSATTPAYTAPSAATACSTGTFSNSAVDNTGQVAPTVGTMIANGGSTVIVPNNALTSNNVYTVFDHNTDLVDYSGMGISIPSGSTILGIEVFSEMKVSPEDWSQLSVSLSHNNGANFTALKTASIYGSPDQTKTLGSTSDIWGRVWSSSDFSNANFKMRIRKNYVEGRSILLDQVKVRVTYSLDTATTFGWTCSGLNGGASTTCTGPKKIDGVCNYPPGGQTTYSAPTASCSAGTPSVVTLTGTFPSQSYQWTCSATNGGIIPTCSAPKSPCPSGQTLCNSTCIPNGNACIAAGIKINSFYFKPSITGFVPTGTTPTCPAYWTTSLTGTGGDPSLVSCTLDSTTVASSSAATYSKPAGLHTLTCTYNNSSATATTTASRCSSGPSFIEN